LGELDAGDFEGKAWDDYRDMFKNEKERFLNIPTLLFTSISDHLHE